MDIHEYLYHNWNKFFYQIRWNKSNSEKFFKTISGLIESGILTSKDIQKEISTDLKFKRDKLVDKLQLVSREEFEVLKRLVYKQEKIIKKLSKKKKTK